MSIILDALKKSETERQQQGQTEFGQVPLRAEQRGTPTWIWIVAALLAINLIVLLAMFLRATPEPAATSIPAPELSPEMPATVFSAPAREEQSDASFAEKLEQVPALSTEKNISPTAVPPAPNEELPRELARPAVVEAIASDSAGIPDIDQLRASGELSIGEQRLDIHVYSEAPSSRFVFINMTKLREGSTTSDGVKVDEITENGVVLSYQGRRFFQARQ